jgi:hypothetical protein
MGRAQETGLANTEEANAATSEAAATASQQAAQADIGTQQSALAKFAAANPYVQGGQAESVTNQQLAGTADATAAAAKAGNQQQAQRTGQNASAGIAAGEAEQQAAQRTMGTQAAGATQSRLAAGAQYGQDVLSGQSNITSQQAALGAQEAGESESQANTAENAGQAANTIWAKLCWVSSELYGGWDDPRTITLRAWLVGPCRETWAGRRFTELYLVYGERLAAKIRNNRLLRAAVRLLFDRLLSAAQKSKRAAQ